MAKREKLFYTLLVLAGAIMLGWALFGGDGIREVWRLQEDQERLAAQIEDLEERKDDNARQVQLLQNDERFIERRAREDLRMVREGETVIMLPEKSGSR